MGLKKGKGQLIMGERNIYNTDKNIHGDDLDFDRMFGENRLHVGALFSVINEQNKLNADNVIEADFSRAVAKAA